MGQAVVEGKMAEETGKDDLSEEVDPDLQDCVEGSLQISIKRCWKLLKFR